jgi:phosphosulfolactate phosphohydrolase-like enzyme
MMVRRGLAHEVAFACRLDEFPVVPALEEGRLRLVA